MNYINSYLDWKAVNTNRAPVVYKPWLVQFHKVIKKSVKNMTITDIIKYHKWVSDKYAPKSVQLSITILKNYFTYLYLTDRATLKPELIKVPVFASQSWQHITQSEFKSITRRLQEYDFWQLRNLVMIRMLFECGMRISELCSLNCCDIDPVSRSLSIRTRKTIDKRIIKWGEETHRLLLKYLIIRKEIARASDALFIGKDYRSNRLTPRTFERKLQDLSREAGIEKKIVPHSFRHGKAHRILAKGGNVADVQQILGHRAPSSSFTYVQMTNPELEERMDKFL